MPEAERLSRFLKNPALKLDDKTRAEAVQIWEDRWDDMHHKLHDAAYLLEPQFRGRDIDPDVRMSAGM